MKSFPLFAVLALALTAPCFAWEISFSEALPDDPRWVSGEVELSVVDDGGVTAVDFMDDSASAGASLSFPLSPEVADEALATGFSFDLRFKHVTEGGNFLVVIRLPGLLPMMFGPYFNQDSGQMLLSGFDGGEKKNLNAEIDNTGDFIDLKAVYRPADSGEPGTMIIEVGGDQVLELQAAATPEAHAHASLEIGARAPDRTGQTLVQSARLTIP